MDFGPQLLFHLLGDYLYQSHWMAVNKTKQWWPALVHAFLYSLPFLIAASPWLHYISIHAWQVIFLSHFFIDRYRLARYVVWAKNWIGPLPRLERRQEIIQRLTDAGLNTGNTSLAIIMDELDKPKTVTINLPWADCSATGNPPDVPPFLAVWLMIIADNTIHLCINWAAIKWL